MTILEAVACPRCGSARSHVVAEGKDHLYGVPGTFHASECDDCALWFQNPRPRLDDLAGLYPDEYLPHGDAEVLAYTPSAGERGYLRRALGYSHLTGGASFPPWHRWMLGVRLVPRYVEDGSVLEIGAGSGAYLLTLRNLGWHHLHGIELVAAAAARARELGFQVDRGPVENLIGSYADGSFDVVVASMLLEHLTDPFALLETAARKLKPNGQLLFSTIVRSSLDEKLYGSYWAGFDFPRHMVYFTRQDLLAALAPRFRSIEIHHQVAPVDFVRASSWRVRDGRGTMLDRAVIALGNSIPVKLAHLPLAFLRRTSRVSFRCTS